MNKSMNNCVTVTVDETNDFNYDEIKKLEDKITNSNPYMLEHLIKSGEINVNGFYGALQYSLLIYVILYRRKDVKVLEELILMLLKNEANINQIVKDTDDEYETSLISAVQLYIGTCIEKEPIEVQSGILRIVELLLENGANPKLIMPNKYSANNIVKKFLAFEEVEQDVKERVKIVDRLLKKWSKKS